MEPQAIGNRLRDIRQKKSQKEFAAELGVSFAAIQKYEAGQSVPGGQVLAALAEKGWNVNWVLTGQGAKKSWQLDEDLMDAVCNVVFAATDKDATRGKLIAPAYLQAVEHGLDTAKVWISTTLDTIKRFGNGGK